MMQVETFEDTLQSELIPDWGEEETNEYNSLIKELELDNLSMDREANPDQYRLPKMNTLQTEVYSKLCPRKEEITDYKGFVPIRILRAMKMAKGLVPSDWKFYVEHSETDPDPILTARRSSYASDAILIGRWGEELLDFPSLVNKAKEIVKVDIRDRIRKAKQFIAMAEADMDSLSESVLHNKEHLPSL